MGGDLRGDAVSRGRDGDRVPVASALLVIKRVCVAVIVERNLLVRVGHLRKLRYLFGLQLELELELEQPRYLESVMIGAGPSSSPEAIERFACFGGRCAVFVRGSGPGGSAAAAAGLAKRRLLEWHAQFSRFDPSSELSRLNDDPRETVPASAMMTRFAEAAVHAAAITGGLLDPTLVGELERAGYAGDFAGRGVPVADALKLAPPGSPASPDPAARWRQVVVDRRRGLITRPVGVRLDSGGIAKGLFGDVLAAVLSWHHSFAVDASGDVRFGGAAGVSRTVRIASPFEHGVVLHTFELAEGAVATSGITNRCWIDELGSMAHHLLDPATGKPAFTGIVQATALAPSGVEAEALAKAALLAGPDAAAGWLAHGGVVVYADGSHEVVAPQMVARAA